MTPKEKWGRLNDPRSLNDYHLSLSENELRAFPEGRKIILAIRLKQRAEKQSNALLVEAGKAARRSIDKIIATVLQKNITQNQ